MRYSTTEDWPEGTVLLMAALISSLRLAAEHGEKFRVHPESVSAALQAVGQRIKELMVPPEARQASSDGVEKMSNGDFEGAEKAFDDAIQLGLKTFVTVGGRGSARLSQGRYEEAEADFTQALASDELPDDTPKGRQQRSTLVYCRGMAREQQKNFAGARDDYQLAADWGYPDAVVWERKASVNLLLNNLDEATDDITRLATSAPAAATTFALRGDLMAARGQYDDAINQYDLSLATEESIDVKFSRALAMLLNKNVDGAMAEYRQIRKTADEDQIAWALHELERLASGADGTAECRSVLLSAE